MTTVKYLSEDFFRELERRAADQPERPGTDLNVQYVVHDHPEADRWPYYFRIRRGRIVEARVGEVEEPSFTITASYPDSVKLQQGKLHPATGFMTGRLKVTGDRAKLLRLMPVFQSRAYQAVIEDLRAISVY